MINLSENFLNAFVQTFFVVAASVTSACDARGLESPITSNRSPFAIYQAIVDKRDAFSP